MLTVFERWSGSMEMLRKNEKKQGRTLNGAIGSNLKRCFGSWHC